ncbi:multicopper oxidase domain-containing protein, partial [Nonomuraea sp. NN258]|uniref:multicopper oxidase domain-containing protein n=1 Tax=Nonomuraea antri TaxID=2730852 RepID=UPI001567F477
MTSINRRFFLRAGLAAVGGAALASCSTGTSTGTSTTFIRPSDERVRAAEAARRPGQVREFRLVAGPGRADLGGPVVDTWLYDDRLPGRPIRVKAGEVVRARLRNGLPQPTTAHWHGLALRNDADGVPGVTQPPIDAGGEHVYEFTAPHPGTYWFHPHHGTQLDRGLYAPLIVEDPAEPLAYDQEWVVVLDDWMDGVTGTPDDVLAELTAMSGMTGMTGTPGDGGHGGHGGAAVPSPAPTPT